MLYTEERNLAEPETNYSEKKKKKRKRRRDKLTIINHLIKTDNHHRHAIGKERRTPLTALTGSILKLRTPVW